MAFYKQDIQPPIDEAPCFKRVMVNTAVGFGVGLVGAWFILVMKKPMLDPRLTPSQLYRKLCLDMLPMTTGAAFLYTSTSCAMEAFRNQRDWKNSALGGALAGGLFMGVKRASAPAGLVGALVFAAAASAPDWSASLAATPDERVASGTSMLARSQASPEGAAREAARSAKAATKFA